MRACVYARPRNYTYLHAGVHGCISHTRHAANHARLPRTRGSCLHASCMTVVMHAYRRHVCMDACRHAGMQEPCTSHYRMDSLGLQSLKLECAQPLSLGATPSGPHYLLASKQTILLLLLFLLLLLLQLLPWICVVGMVLLLPPQDLLKTPSEKGKYAVHAPTIHALAHLLAFTHTKGGPTRQTQIAGLPLSALAATRTQRFGSNEDPLAAEERVLSASQLFARENDTRGAAGNRVGTSVSEPVCRGPTPQVPQAGGGGVTRTSRALPPRPRLLLPSWRRLIPRRIP